MSFDILPWQLVIIVGAVLTSLGQVFNKYQVSRATSLQVVFYKYLSSMTLITIWWYLSNTGWPKHFWLFFIYGLTSGAIITLYTKATRLSLSKTVLTIPANQILGIGLAAIILKEWQLFNLATASGRQLLLALLLVPIMMYFFYEKTKKVQQWSVLILIVMIYLAMTRVFIKYFLSQNEPLQILFLQYWGSWVAVTLGLKLKNHRIYIGKKFALRGLIQGLTASTGVWLYYTGLKKATVSQTTLLSMPIFLVLTLMIGLLGFKEIKDMTTKKWLGMGVALLMAILVVTANH